MSILECPHCGAEFDPEVYDNVKGQCPFCLQDTSKVKPKFAFRTHRLPRVINLYRDDSKTEVLHSYTFTEATMEIDHGDIVDIYVSGTKTFEAPDAKTSGKEQFLVWSVEDPDGDAETEEMNITDVAVGETVEFMATRELYCDAGSVITCKFSVRERKARKE